MFEIQLSPILHNKARAEVDLFLKKNLKKVESVAGKHLFKYDLDFEFIIVSSKAKYLFNYLSGAFGNKDLKRGIEKIHEFYTSPRFLRITKNLSGRAISDISVLERAEKSMRYFTDMYGEDEKEFTSTIKELFNNLKRILESKKGVILLGIPEREVIVSDRLLAHEIFHLILASNNILFEKINTKYDYLDEELASLLASEYETGEIDREKFDTIMKTYKRLS